MSKFLSSGRLHLCCTGHLRSNSLTANRAEVDVQQFSQSWCDAVWGERLISAPCLLAKTHFTAILFLSSLASPRTAFPLKLDFHTLRALTTLIATFKRMRSPSSCSVSLHELHTQKTPASISKRGERMLAAHTVPDIPYFADMQLNSTRYPIGKLIQRFHQDSLTLFQIELLVG